MASIDLIIKDKSKIEQILSHARGLIERAIVAGDVVVRLCRPNRNTAQNALLWALLTEVSQQVEHCGMKLSHEDWKALMSAAFENEVRMVPNLNNNGFVMLGARTSQYSKKKFSEFIEFIYAAGSDRGVEWSPVTTTNYNEVMK
jgi:hypothetical protein